MSRLTGLASVASTRSGEDGRLVPATEVEQGDGAVAAQAGGERRDVVLVAVGDAVAPEALALGEAVLRR